MCTSGWDFSLQWIVHIHFLCRLNFFSLAQGSSQPLAARHPLQSLPRVASAVEHSKPRYTDAASVKLLIFANGVVLLKVRKIISCLWGGGKQSIYIYICIYIIWMHMYMMTSLIFPYASLPSMMWLLAVVKWVSSYNQQYCTPRWLSDFPAASKPFIVLAVVRRLNDTAAKFLFIPFCN